jgi:hypothetical protein
MLCKHCGIDVGNRMVIMEDNTTSCYTCGRLEADWRCRARDRKHFLLTLKVLEGRKDLYK